jgi:hypothetical protein
MPIITQKLASFNAVAPGSVASLSVPTTTTYAAIDIQIKHGAGSALMTLADMKTLINNVRVMIDGNAAWNITGKNLIELNAFYNQNGPDGILALNFAQGYLDNPANEDALALGTADVGNVTLEIELDATVVSPKMEATASVYSGANRPIGQFLKLEDTHYAATGVGKFEIPDLPVVGMGVGLKALHFTTDQIDTVEIKGNGNILSEVNGTVNTAVMDRRTRRTVGRTEQSGYFHVDIAANRLNDVIGTGAFRDFRVKLEMLAAANFAVLHELVVDMSKTAK